MARMLAVQHSFCLHLLAPRRWHVGFPRTGGNKHDHRHDLAQGADVVSVGPQDEVGTIARILSENRIGAVLVRDGAATCSASSASATSSAASPRMARRGDLPAAELMTARCTPVTPRTKVRKRWKLMTDRRVRTCRCSRMMAASPAWSRSATW
jgi:hypothetical protein